MVDDRLATLRIRGVPSWFSYTKQYGLLFIDLRGARHDKSRIATLSTLAFEGPIHTHGMTTSPYREVAARQRNWQVEVRT